MSDACILKSQTTIHNRAFSVQSKTHEVDCTSLKHEQAASLVFKTRSVCLPRSLKFKYEKGGRRDMVNRTSNLRKAKHSMFLAYRILLV